MKPDIKSVVLTFVFFAASCLHAGEGLLPSDGHPEVVRVGAGSYASRPPRDQNKRPWLEGTAGWGDDSQVFSRMKLYVTPGRKGPIPSTDWWTGLVSQRWSTELWAYPAMLKAGPSGMELSHPKTWQLEPGARAAVMVPHRRLRISAHDFQPLHAEAEDWSDWLVKVRMPDEQGRSLRFTLVHGAPLTYIETENVVPFIELPDKPGLFGPGERGAADRVGIRYTGEKAELFGVYATPGTEFVLKDGRLNFVFPAGKTGYISVAPLEKEADLEFLAPFASVVPRKTSITWTYEPENGRVDTVWTVDAEDLSGRGEQRIVQGWHPHHYEKPSLAGFETADLNYRTPRGQLRCAVGNRFEIAFPFTGLVPEYPSPELLGPCEGYDPGQMRRLVRNHLKRTGYGSETYWGGKSIRLFARHMEHARQLGLAEETEVFRDRAAEAVRDWLRFDPGEAEHFFAWYPTWGSFVGCRSRDNQNPGVDILQDHHMCYGYHLYAAAMLMFQDPKFAEDWGPMATLVARDYASWLEDDELFCRFRNLDPWCGHSWSGGMGNTEGNGQESSSEAMQGYGAMFLLGEATGNREMRDAAAFCWAMESRGIAEYYFDRDKRNFPAEWPHTAVANLHTNGIGFWTWFSGDPFWMHAIQWLPMSPLISHLAHDRRYAASDFARVMKIHEGGKGWNGYLGDGTVACMMLNYLACSDPDEAARVLDRLMSEKRGGTDDPEATGAYWHIHSLRNYGPMRFDAWTDVATSQAFGHSDKAAGGKEISWAVFNAQNTPKEVRCFVQGREVARFTAPPRRMSVMRNGKIYTDPLRMEAVPPEKTSGTDFPVSRDGIATASSRQGDDVGADKAIDGNPNTRWSSGFSDTEWIAVDLGMSYPLDRAVLVWEAAFGKDYDLEGSEDGRTWKLLASKRDGSGGTDEIPLKGKARHVRLKGIKRGSDWGWSLFSFDIYAAQSDRKEPRLVVEPSLALLNERDTAQFAAFMESPDGKRTPVKVRWSAQGGKHCSGKIDDKGVFTPEGAGVFSEPKVVIRAETEGRRAQAVAVIEEALRVKRLELTPKKAGGALSMTVGDSLRFDAEAFDQFNARIDRPITMTIEGPLKREGDRVTATALGNGAVTAELAGVRYRQEIAVLPPDRVNIALGRPATASSAEGPHVAGLAFDGDSTTRWSSEFSDPQWIQVDLRTVRPIDRVILHWEAAHAEEYFLEVGRDDRNWTVVHHQANCRGKTEEIKLSKEFSGRFVRLRCVKRSGGYGNSLFEMEVYPAR